MQCQHVTCSKHMQQCLASFAVSGTTHNCMRGGCRARLACTSVVYARIACHVWMAAHIKDSLVYCFLQIWSTNQPNHVSEIDIKANVCCAKYNPGSSYEIAVGAADHTVLTYDLRRSDRAVHTYRGAPAFILTPLDSLVLSSIQMCLIRFRNSRSHVG